MAIRRQDLIGLAAFLGASLVVSVMGGLATASSVNSWYPQLAKPSFNPPDWVFAPVWTALYIAMAVAGWRVWRKTGFDGALTLYAVQLALNLAWSFLFFGMQRVGLAAVEIVLLLLMIAATAVAFARYDRIAALLMLPYLAWVGFAAVLNGAIWAMN